MTLDHRIEAIEFTGTRYGSLKLQPKTVEAIGNSPEAVRRLFDATDLALSVFPGSAFLGFREHRPMEGA